MVVWNLGCIMLEMLIQTHKLSTKEIMNKFQGEPFSFQKLGMKEHTYKGFSEEMHEALGKMLHFFPKKRMTLEQLFENRFLSEDVAKHFEKNKPKPNQRIEYGKSSVRMGQLSVDNLHALEGVKKELEDRENEKLAAIRSSKLDLVDDKSFEFELGEVSTRITKPTGMVFNKVKAFSK